MQSSSINNKLLVPTKSARNAKKPAVANTTINELIEREKKHLFIYGVTESSKTILADKKAEEEQKLESIFNAIGKREV